jgi:hypothetical protein
MWFTIEDSKGIKVLTAGPTIGAKGITFAVVNVGTHFAVSGPLMK